MKNIKNEFNYREVGGRIKELRGEKKQKDWAVELGCDQSYVSQVENGINKPSLAFLKKAVSVTGSSYDWILTGEEKKG